MGRFAGVSHPSGGVPDRFSQRPAGEGAERDQGVLGDRPLRLLPARVRTAGRLPAARARPLGALRPARRPPLLPGGAAPVAGRPGGRPAGAGPGARERGRLRAGVGRRGPRLPVADPAARLAGPGRARRGVPAPGPGRPAAPVVRLEATRDYERWLAEHPDARPWIRTSTWQVPINWFVLFDDEGASTARGPPGGPGAALPHAHGPGTAPGGAGPARAARRRGRAC